MYSACLLQDLKSASILQKNKFYPRRQLKYLNKTS